MWGSRPITVSYGGASIRTFAEEQCQSPFSGAAGLRHGLKKNCGAVDRAGPAGAVYFPSPWLGRGCPVLYDDGKIGVTDHGEHHCQTALRGLVAKRVARASLYELEIEAAIERLRLLLLRRYAAWMLPTAILPVRRSSWVSKLTFCP
jgi:hypothetical protein